jgi:hypothetical protein
MKVKIAIVSLILLILTACGESFEKKYTNNCIAMNIQSTQWCQCVAKKLDVSLTKEQKDIAVNGAKEINPTALANAIGSLKPTTEAIASCTTKENKSSGNSKLLTPEEHCIVAKQRAIKASEQFFSNIFNGARGASVPGSEEAFKESKYAGVVCGIPDYTPYELIKEVEMTASGFKLKNDKTPANTISQSNSSAAPLESIEFKSEVHEINSTWRVIWRLSEDTGDTYGYFFKSNSDIDKVIRQSCQTKKVCNFNFEFSDLDYEKIKDSLPKDFAGLSFYGEIKRIIEIKN